MPQTRFSFFPESIDLINNYIGFQKKNGIVYYFNGAMPVFQHPEKDYGSFRLFTSQLVVNGNVISHRFGRINTGIYELFGLDNSNIRFGFEYAIIDDLTIAVGRSSFEKTYDGYLKYRLLKQKTGAENFPVSLTLFGSSTVKTLKDYEPENEPPFVDRLTYTTQILLARKFSLDFSLQIMPTYIHFNNVPTSNDPNDIFAVGIGARIKLSKRFSINGEYYYTINPFTSVTTYNSLALGVDIETGGIYSS